MGEQQVTESTQQQGSSGSNMISFMSANYVARQLGFNMTGGWGQGDRATNDYYRPVETFAERFDELLRQVRALGFDAMDIWTAHLHWSWATEEHIRAARQLLDRHGLRVTSLAAGFGATREEFESACRLAVAMGTDILAGSSQYAAEDRRGAVAILKDYGVKLALENHPAEKTPADMLAKIGDGGDGTIGTAVDTGWWGTHGYDAARAIEELGQHVLIVHLKDVRAAGAHHTCPFGEGVVPIEACVRVLQRGGYRGAYSIEHEPDDYDPGDEVSRMRLMLQGWLARQG